MNREIDKNKEFKGDFLYYIGLTGSLVLFALACNYNAIVNNVFKGNVEETVEPTPIIQIEDDTKEEVPYTDKTVNKDGKSEQTPRSGKPINVHITNEVTK